MDCAVRMLWRRRVCTEAKLLSGGQEAEENEECTVHMLAYTETSITHATICHLGIMAQSSQYLPKEHEQVGTKVSMYKPLGDI